MNAPEKRAATRGYPDLHEHLEELKKRGLLLEIDRAIDKDAELHPLVRWQFVGGMDEAERKAFLFTHIVDGSGRKYDIPVVVGAIAANRAIYSAGMGAPLSEIQGKWDDAIAHPIPPREVKDAPCHEVVHQGKDLLGEGKGLDRLPIPISTPGFDSAPTLTATNVITRDPETGVQNMGTYRAALKASDRLVVRMATRVGGAGGYLHYVKYQKLGMKTMPCAIVLGCPPYVAFMGPQKLPVGVDEFTVAGGLAGSPINVVKAKTVDLLVPAESEIVIEGLINTEYCEPEAPFGESHGHVNLQEFNAYMDVTAITRRRDAILTSIISQVTPSESSLIKRIGMEPLFLNFLRDTLGINVRVVEGYPDSGAIFLAVDRGELNGRTVDLSSMKSLKPDWLAPNGAMRALVQFARATRHPDFPDVPTARELARNDEARVLIEFSELSYRISRPLAAPPGIPPERGKALQDAFLAVQQDADYRAEAARLKQEVTPIDSRAVLDTIDNLAAAPAYVLDYLRRLMVDSKGN